MVGWGTMFDTEQKEFLPDEDFVWGDRFRPDDGTVIDEDEVLTDYETPSLEFEYEETGFAPFGKVPAPDSHIMGMCWGSIQVHLTSLAHICEVEREGYQINPPDGDAPRFFWRSKQEVLV